MKRLLIWGVLIAFVLVSSALGDTLTVLHLNDTHSHLLPYGPKDPSGKGMWGGMARVATLVGMNRATEPNVMLLHAGDLFVGDFMFQKYVGIPELEIMKGLGYDAMALGNHEFDLYPSTLKYVLDQAGFPGGGFPILSANLDCSADPEMAYFVKPYAIKQCGGVKVGIFGLITEFVNSGSNPQPLVALPPLDVAQKWIDTLKIGHGCDVVILLSHLGIDMEKAVAAYTSGIDVIVGGHSHTQLDQPIKIGNTLVLQAGEFAHYLGKLHLIVEGGAVVGYDYQLMPVDQNVPEAPAISGMLAYLAAGVEADPRFGLVFSSPVAQAAIDLDKNFGNGLVMDNPLGNLISDAYRASTGTDIGIHPQGFINQPIWAGPLVGNDIFQAVPYGFDQTSGYGLKLATLETDGMSLMAGFEFAVYNLPYFTDFFLQASNLSFAYNSSKPAGARVDYASITIGGQPINPFGHYTVTVPDGVVPFLAQIPGFSMWNLNITNTFMYTVTRDFMSAHSPVAYYRQGRICDLAALGDPVKGAAALADLGARYRGNGMISRVGLADQLMMKYALVGKHLQYGRQTAARAILLGMNAQLADQAIGGFIDAATAARLQYLNGKLIESMAAGSSFAGKSATDGTDSPSVPQSFALLQNYPNPFNPTTQIDFALPTPSTVVLEVFNVLGQRVRTLVNEPMSAGVHRVEWDGRGDDGYSVASGVYYYRLTAETATATRKMMLTK
ncbi:MAG: 5'-nucleotidase C-terminal domain-containing protein [candidate division Zixibacteria bacterium]|nr:5'-nucleotidase C-terminal domain-containing protein [candidate division Zixibacteria bacterium]